MLYMVWLHKELDAFIHLAFNFFKSVPRSCIQSGESPQAVKPHIHIRRSPQTESQHLG